ncbi:MAG TPA: ATP-binding protein [Actinomycetota bacterium]|nr:ATP-binding protein [Actinomycetota bacterium]
MTTSVETGTDPIDTLYTARIVARRRLLSHLVEARDHERQRIASEIHDEPLQVLSTISTRLQRLRLGQEEPTLRYEIAQIEETLSAAIERLRGLTFELAAAPREEPGLVAEMRAMLERAAEESDLEARLSERVVREPSLANAIAAYRILQEALANIQKHARASRVDIAVEAERDLYVRVEDDGVGFEPEGVVPSPSHMGTAIMRQRAMAAGGWLRLESEPGKGTMIEFHLPGREQAEPVATD